MHHDQFVGAEDLHRLVDLLHRGHAGRQDDRLAGGGAARAAAPGRSRWPRRPCGSPTSIVSRKSTDGTSHGEANQSRPRVGVLARSLGTPHGRTRPGTGTPCRSSRPTASPHLVPLSAGTQISGVRFWNFTACAPASAATSISCGDLEVAVVVDADLGDHVDRLAGADQRVADRHRAGEPAGTVLEGKACVVNVALSVPLTQGPDHAMVKR